tara:strand:+ start:417 stop:644 length:228 start_codon:yes stop_codon:yes gene_type:complete
MNFEPTATSNEDLLFQGFWLLFSKCATDEQKDDVCRCILFILANPDVTAEHAQNACDRAIEAHVNENLLEKTFNG